MIDSRALVLRGDAFAQQRRAVRLRVAQMLGEERGSRDGIFDELAKRQRLHTALGQVEVHLMFECGLQPLQFKRLDLHGGHFTLHASEPARLRLRRDCGCPVVDYTDRRFHDKCRHCCQIWLGYPAAIS